RRSCLAGWLPGGAVQSGWSWHGFRTLLIDLLLWKYRSGRCEIDGSAWRLDRPIWRDLIWMACHRGWRPLRPRRHVLPVGICHHRSKAGLCHSRSSADEGEGLVSGIRPPVQSGVAALVASGWVWGRRGPALAFPFLTTPPPPFGGKRHLPELN